MRGSYNEVIGEVGLHGVAEEEGEHDDGVNEVTQIRQFSERNEEVPRQKNIHEACNTNASSRSGVHVCKLFA